MIEHLYQRSLKMHGPEDPGTKRLKERMELAKAGNSTKEFRVLMDGLGSSGSNKTNEAKPKPTQDSDSSLSEE